MNEVSDLFIRLGASIRKHRAKRCFVNPADAVLLTSLLEAADKFEVRAGGCGPAPDGSFMNFDGAWMMSDPTMPAGEFRLEAG